MESGCRRTILCDISFALDGALELAKATRFFGRSVSNWAELFALLVGRPEYAQCKLLSGAVSGMGTVGRVHLCICDVSPAPKTE